MMKSDPPKESRITKDQRAARLSENEMIVFFGHEIARLNTHGSAHPEMNPDGILAGKPEDHLLPVRLGFDELPPWQLPHERVRIGLSEDAFPRVKLDRADRRAESGVPLLAIEFDLRELRHAGR